LLIKVSCDGTTEGDYFTNLQKFEEENLQSRIARIETRHLIDYQKWLESQKISNEQPLLSNPWKT